MRKYKEKDPEATIGKMWTVYDEEGRGKISVTNKTPQLQELTRSLEHPLFQLLSAAPITKNCVIFEIYSIL